MSDKYAVITAHRTEFPVHLMCRVLAVSRAGYYAAKGRALSARTTADVSPAATITDTFTVSHGCYGAPRVQQALRAAGHRVGRKCVARLMRAASLQARRRRRFAVMTDSAHTSPLTDNVVARQFAVGGPVNTVWVSDMTFIPTGEGWLYLAAQEFQYKPFGQHLGQRRDGVLRLDAQTRAHRPAALRDTPYRARMSSTIASDSTLRSGGMPRWALSVPASSPNA